MRNLSKNPHPSCAIYEERCPCKETYIGEMKQNVEIRWEEHSDIKKISEPSRHLKSNPAQAFTWKVLLVAAFNDHIRKILEASFIALSRLPLNEQINSKKLLLFRNGIA